MKTSLPLLKLQGVINGKNVVKNVLEIKRTLLMQTRQIKFILVMLILLTGMGNQAEAQLGNLCFSATTGTYTYLGVGSTAVNGIEQDDNNVINIPIGFTFNYLGTNFTTGSVSSNGWFSFANTDPSNANSNSNNIAVTTPSTLLRTLFPLWDDLDGAGGIASYQTTGAAGSRVFTMEWRNWQWNYNSSAAISFQVKLYETSNIIEFRYRQEAGAVNTSGSGYSVGASIGLNDATGGSTHFLSLNNSGAGPTASTTVATNNITSKPATNQIYQFTPQVAPTISLSSGAGTNVQTFCITNALGSITYSVGGGATGASVSGLPAGVTGTYSAGVFTISGTPTATGIFNYTVTTTGTCNAVTATGTITVQANSTISLSSAAGTANQTKCINTAITNITYSLGGGATGATVTGLPTGVSGSYAAGVYTISGSATQTGVFSYTVTTTGPCTNTSASGSLTIDEASTISLSSAPGTNVQSFCIGSTLTDITYSIGGTATGASITAGSLPTGVTGSYDGIGTFTISGTATSAGTYNFTVTATGTCPVSLTGTITVTSNATLNFTSAVGTNAQSRCVNTAITNITYLVGGSGTGANVSGLPAGVTGSYNGGTKVFTISGTPTVTGPFSYTVTTTGPCVNASLGGTITVNPLPAVFSVTGGGAYCSGGVGVPVGLSGSASGINYQLKLGAGNVGAPVAGTGSAISFGNQTTAGTYTVVATNTVTTCTSTMSGSAVVSIHSLPLANAGANQVICAAGSTILGAFPPASGGAGSYTYVWTGSGLSSTSAANPVATPASFPASYSLVVSDANGCSSAASTATVSVGTATKNWIGDGTGGAGPNADFNNPQNWSPAGVPGSCNDVNMNLDISSIFDFGGSTVVSSLSANTTIKSLNIQISGFLFLSGGSNFRLDAGTRTLTVLNNTILNADATSFFAVPARAYISVGNGGTVVYGGNLTTTVSNGCTVYPFYATTNNTGKFYVNANATLGGVGNDFGNKPAQVIFNGTGTQTLTQNSGTQTIFLGVTSTDIGETNSPTVVMTGAGTGGFRNQGNLNVYTNATLDIGSQVFNRNNAGGSLNLSAGSFMKLGKISGGVAASNFPLNYTTYNFNATSTVEYNATAPNQTVVSTPLYGHLTLSNAGNKNANGNINVQKNITIQSSAIFTGSTYTISLGGNWTNYGQLGFLEQTSSVDFTGATAQSINTTGGEIFYNLRKSGAGTTTLLSDAAVQGAGTPSFTLSAGTFDAGTRTFNSTTGALNISAGLLKLAKLNAVLPEFAIATYNITGGSIELYGNGNQQFRGGRAYRDLFFSNTGNKTVTADVPSITGTITISNTAVLDADVYTVGGAGTNLTMTDLSTYKTAGTGTRPDVLGVYTLGTGTTLEFSNNSPLFTQDVRLGLPQFYHIAVSGSNVANPDPAVGIQIQAGGSFTVKNGGIFKVGNADGFAGSTTTAIDNSTNPSIILEDGSTIEYFGGAAGTTPQTISNTMPYKGFALSGSSVKTAPSGTLSIQGDFTNHSSVFAHNNGTVLLNGTSLQHYISTGTPLQFYKLTADNPVNVQVDNDLVVLKEFSLGTAGKVNMATGHITLKSDVNSTARVATINTTDALTYGTGGFIIERYIAAGTTVGHHSKSWQLLSVPVNGTQTIKAAWQESAASPNANPVPGYGTQITSNAGGNAAASAALGFDVYTPAGPTVKTYNASTNNWDGIGSTNSTSIANPKGYMVFVRGDRGVTAFNQLPQPTTLRTTGKLYAPSSLAAIAPPVINVLPGKFETIGNPYASAIDFTMINKPAAPAVDDKFYVWDPLLTANYNGLGGYQTISAVNGWKPIPGGTANYDANVASTIIQSGQAFFVYASGAGGAVTFTEAAKVTNDAMVFRQNNLNGNNSYLRLNLFNAASDSAKLSDGNVVAFGEGYSNTVDADDALKIANTNENFGIGRSGKYLALEAKSPVMSTDTVFYQFYNLKKQTYRLQFKPENMHATGMTAFLVDKFAGTSTVLSLETVSNVNFTITTDVASSMADRFYVVFKALAPVPVTFTGITANRQDDQSIRVNWKVDNEISMQQFEVERSADGRNFTKLHTAQPLNNNGGSATYTHVDVKPISGDNFYRIKALSIGGRIQYSSIAKVSAVKTGKDISVYPNPVVDKSVHVYFRNQEEGTYAVQLTNKLGQVVYNGQVQVSGTLVHKVIALGKAVSSGQYQLTITAQNGARTIQKLVIE